MAGGRGRKPKKGEKVRKRISPLRKFWKSRRKEILAGSAMVFAVFLFGVTAGLYSSHKPGAVSPDPVKKSDPAERTVKTESADNRAAAMAPSPPVPSVKEPAKPAERERIPAENDAPAREAARADSPRERAPERAKTPAMLVERPPANAPKPTPEIKIAKAAPDPSIKPSSRPKSDLLVSLPPQKEPPEVAVRGTAAIIIDDIGQSMEAVERLLAIGEPITFAVLPHQAHSRQAALRAREKGQVVMLHLPMEPRGKENNPGPGALMASFDKASLLRLFAEDMDWVPGAAGVNNHMGSLLTEMEESMAPLMEEMASRGLFFVDSMTSPNTVAYETARRAGLPSARRDVFLDNERDVKKIMEALDLLAEKALKNGSAVAIGHPYPETIRALELYAPTMASKGVRYAPITRLLRGGEAAGAARINRSARACSGENC